MPHTLKTEWIMDVKAEVGAPVIIGETQLGLRRMIPVGAGTFEGPQLRGSVIAGGADWQVVRRDGVMTIEARYILHTDDGVEILVTNRGMRHGPQAVLDRIAAGEAVDPSEYYFRTIPEFEAPAGRYEWLNRAVFIASGERSRSDVVIHFHRVL